MKKVKRYLLLSYIYSTFADYGLGSVQETQGVCRGEETLDAQATRGT